MQIVSFNRISNYRAKSRAALFMLFALFTTALQAQIMQLHNDPEFDEYRIRKHLFIRGFASDTIETMISNFKYQYFQARNNMAPLPPDGVASDNACTCIAPSCWLDGGSPPKAPEYNSLNLGTFTPYNDVLHRGNFFDDVTTGLQGWYALNAEAYNFSGSWTYGTVWADLSANVGPAATRYKLNTDPEERDPFTSEKIIPNGSVKSLRVGDPDFGVKGQRVATKFQVSSSSKTFDIRYSVVLYDPPVGHSHPATRPAFSIRVFVKPPEQNHYYEDCCAKYEIYSSPNIPGFRRSGTDDRVVYKPWSLKSIDLTRYETGSDVVVEVSTHHCAWGPHFSYAYVDGMVNSPKQLSKKGQLCIGVPVTFSADVFGTFKSEHITWSVLKAGSSTPDETQHTVTYPEYKTIAQVLNEPGNQPIKDAVNYTHTFNPAPSELPVSYKVTLTIEDNGPGAIGCPPVKLERTVVINDCQPVKVECEDCIPTFSPVPGKKYMVSAWVKQQKTTAFQSSYTGPEIWIRFNGVNKIAGPFKASGPIIDGWQKVEEVFTVADETSSLEIELRNSATDDVFFDDIRVYPFDGALRSFVYNARDFKLQAELDENNYATFYDYDEQGNLVRVKKETVKGVQTVKEIFTNTRKNP